MIWKALEKYRDEGLLVVRLGFGLGFLYFHGWSKLVEGPERWTRVGSAMESFGIGFGHTTFGFIASLAESLGGVMIALGLFFQPVCLVLAIVMVVASGNHIATGRGSPAHSLKNATLFLGLMLIGPGKYSLDYLIQRKLEERRAKS